MQVCTRNEFRGYFFIQQNKQTKLDRDKTNFRQMPLQTLIHFAGLFSESFKDKNFIIMPFLGSNISTFTSKQILNIYRKLLDEGAPLKT